jgi:multiple sugar transport system substrate-binding protein
MARQFEEQYPEIKVEVSSVAGLEEKLSTAIVGGAAPDVVFFPRYLTGQWAARAMLEPMSQFAAAYGILEDHFFKATWDEVSYNGEIWGIPFSTDARVLFYNRQSFMEMGLDSTKPPKNWDELVSYSKRLTARTPEGKLEKVGFVPIWGNQSLLMYIWQNGGSMFNEDYTKVLMDSEEAVGALQWVCDFVDIYGYGDLGEMGGSFGSAEQTPWFTGQIAMITEGSWNLHGLLEYVPAFYEQDLGVAALPGNVEQATVAGGFSFVIPSGAAHLAAAQAFIAWAVQPKNQLGFALETGVIPADVRAGHDEYFRDHFYWRPFIDAMDLYARARPAHPAYPEIEGLMFEALWKALAKEQSAFACLEDATTRGQAILDYYNAVFGF